MKKLSLIFIPVMAVSFLTNCNNKSPRNALDEYTWEEIKEISKNYQAPERFKIGDKKKVQLKTQDLNQNGKIDKGEFYQTVRIIGFDHDFIDFDSDGEGKKVGAGYKTVGITFEFADKICDPNGLSLSTYWNDFSGKDELDYNAALHYKTSSVRSALIGRKDGGMAELNWYRYYGMGGESSSKTNYHFISELDPCYKKSVYDMLPDDLRNAITAPYKEVLDYDDNSKKLVSTWIQDPLFLLSPREVGFNEEVKQETATYTYRYYQGHTARKDKKRIKTQMNNADANKVEKNVLDGNYKEAHKDNPGYHSYSHAGCRTNPSQCMNPDWLRTPYMGKGSSCAFCIEDDEGSVFDHNVRQYANAVAPAFCI